ncbi:MAG: F0F1 ATP synthase subunit delta [Actinomycetota bacterium]
MMNAASREALATLRERLDALSGRFSTGEGRIGLAGELYSVARLLSNEPRLRRTIADPASDPQSRGELINGLVDGKVSASAAELVRLAAEQRWSAPWDLVDALEQVADDALFTAAESESQLDEVEDELFRFERILDGQPSLTTLLDAAAVQPARRIELLRSLLAGKVTGVTMELLEHAVGSSRKRNIELTIDRLLEAAAQRKERSIARVVSAVDLNAEQESRIATALAAIYGRPMSVRTEIDPGVRGGLVIRVGDEVIDGSVASRFAAVRKALAS